MHPNDHFDVLFLLARPAAGKSEIIAFLKSLPAGERLARYHVGEIAEIDDFPMLWSWFEEDDILQEMGLPRLHSSPDQYFLNQAYWNVLIRKMGLEYARRLRDGGEAFQHYTTLVEFSRGKEHGGYREAFHNLSPELVRRGAVLYVNVSFEESLRKNRRRFNPEKPDSILEHGLSDEKMARLYGEVDWKEMAHGTSGVIPIQGARVPYAVMENDDDVTTHPGDALAQRLATTLDQLWEEYSSRSKGE
jgi:hypothetical protein